MFGPVITGDNDERVLREVIPLQRFKNPAEEGVALEKPVAILGILLHQVLGAALPDKLIRRHDGLMRNADREVEKKWLACFPLVEPLHHFLRHERLVRHRRHMGDHLILFDDGADIPGVREAVKVIKPERIGTTSHLRPDWHFLFATWLTSYPIHAEMPLADAGRRVTLRLEQRCHRRATRRDNRLGECGQHTELPDAGRIAPREKAVASWGANCRGRVRIREPHPLRG